MHSERQQLQPEESLTIASQHLQGLSIRTTSRMLERLPAAISRELTPINLPDGDACFPAGRSMEPDAPGFSRNYLHAEGNPSGVMQAQRRGESCRRGCSPTPWLRHAHAAHAGAQTGTAGIHIRRPDIEDRLPQGHREGDLIKGADDRSPAESRANGYAPSHY